MRRCTLLLCCLLLTAGLLYSQETPDWSMRTFAASLDDVFNAARATLQAQHHRITNEKAAMHLLRFRARGVDMVLIIAPAGEPEHSMVQVTSDISGSAGVFQRRARDVTKILDEIERRLHARVSSITQASPCAT